MPDNLVAPVHRYPRSDGPSGESSDIGTDQNGEIFLVDYGRGNNKWGSPTSATLVPAGGDTKDLGGGMVWNYPSRAQCLTCHTQAVEGSIALESRQLNVGNPLADLAHAGLLNSPNPAALAPFPDIQD